MDLHFGQWRHFLPRLIRHTDILSIGETTSSSSLSSYIYVPVSEDSNHGYGIVSQGLSELSNNGGYIKEYVLLKRIPDALPMRIGGLPSSEIQNLLFGCNQTHLSTVLY